MGKQLYTEKNSDYLSLHPTWHVEDSSWKATQIIKMIRKNDLKPKTIAEVGCGAGEILNQLHERLEDKSIEYFGFEIAPDAFALCQQRAKPGLTFYQEDLCDNAATYDVLLLIDVFEHVDDYMGFVNSAKKKAEYKIYHIPLDISVSSVLRNIPVKTRNRFGHLHYFMKDTALSTIRDTGQEIIDYFYTSVSIKNNQKIRTKILNLPRQILYRVNPDFTVRLLGGYSLLVLAK